jgi:hypothetical protein
MNNLTANAVLGLACILFALAVALIWVPLDTETWLVERSRGRFTVGDSLAPTLAAVLILIAGLMLLREVRGSEERPTLENLRFIGAMIAFGTVGLLAMRWAGPAAVALFMTGEEYRLLRDTPPWKYIGFALGGGILVFAMIAFVEEKASWLALLVALLAVAGIIFLYDVPFEDVLLPPNGDV